MEGMLLGIFEVGGAILKPDDPAFSFGDEYTVGSVLMGNNEVGAGDVALGT